MIYLENNRKHFLIKLARRSSSCKEFLRYVFRYLVSEPKQSGKQTHTIAFIVKSVEIYYYVNKVT